MKLLQEAFCDTQEMEIIQELHSRGILRRSERRWNLHIRKCEDFSDKCKIERLRMEKKLLRNYCSLQKVSVKEISGFPDVQILRHFSESECYAYSYNLNCLKSMSKGGEAFRPTNTKNDEAGFCAQRPNSKWATGLHEWNPANSESSVGYTIYFVMKKR